MTIKTRPLVGLVEKAVAWCGAVLLAWAGVVVAAEAGRADGIWSGGGDVRLRDEYFDGASTLSTTAPMHGQNYLRLRTRLWAAWKPLAGFSVRARAVAEPRYWTQTSSTKTFSGRTGLEERYALLDELAVEWKTKLGAAGDLLTVTLGRQDVKLGEAGNSWLISDGTPGDGSWTAYFDAARATVSAVKWKTTFDVVVIDQDSDLNDRLPTLGRSEAYSMTEDNEFGVIFYAANRSLAAARMEAFVIYKENRHVLANGNDSELTTPGVRVWGDVGKRWQYNVEVAHQFGEKRDPTVKNPVPAATRRDVRAWGGNARLTWLARDARENRVSLITEYMSGDDPATVGRDEMFDLLWGRCPRFSDIVATAFSTENGCTYQAANLVRVGPEWSFAQSKTTGLTLGWQRLFAPETTPTRTAKLAMFSRSGHERGDFFRATWRKKFSKNLSGLLTGEALKQGDFYARRDTLTFVRAEVAVTF